MLVVHLHLLLKYCLNLLVLLLTRNLQLNWYLLDPLLELVSSIQEHLCLWFHLDFPRLLCLPCLLCLLALWPLPRY